MGEKGDARECGQHSRATNITGGKGAAGATPDSARHDTATRGTCQELQRLGSRAERIALRCPEPRQRARFAQIARFLLRAARGGRHGD